MPQLGIIAINNMAKWKLAEWKNNSNLFCLYLLYVYNCQKMHRKHHKNTINFWCTCSNERRILFRLFFLWKIMTIVIHFHQHKFLLDSELAKIWKREEKIKYPIKILLSFRAKSWYKHFWGSQKWVVFYNIVIFFWITVFNF